MSEQTNISFEAALMIALRADAQKELDTLPTPEQLEELYPDTSQWDERMEMCIRDRHLHFAPSVKIPSRYPGQCSNW